MHPLTPKNEKFADFYAYFYAEFKTVGNFAISPTVPKICKMFVFRGFLTVHAIQYTVYLLTVHAIQYTVYLFNSACYTVYLLRCYPAVYIQELSSKPKTVSLIRHTVYTHSYSEFRQNFSNSVAMLHFDNVCKVECNCTTVCALCSVIVLVYVHFAV